MSKIFIPKIQIQKNVFSCFRYLFFLDMKDVKQSLKICVKKCPDRTINSLQDVCQFYKETGSQLCHPAGDFSPCNDRSKNKTGYCPTMPVYESIPILNRCIPKALKDATATLISNLYGVLNSWEVIEQILGDLYKTWREILGLSFLAFCKQFVSFRIIIGGNVFRRYEIHEFPLFVRKIRFFSKFHHFSSFVISHDCGFSPIGQHRHMDRDVSRQRRLYRYESISENKLAKEVDFNEIHFRYYLQMTAYFRWYGSLMVDLFRYQTNIGRNQSQSIVGRIS